MFFQKQRIQAINLVKKLNIPHFLIEVICNEDIIKKRLIKRKEKDPQTPGYKL